MAQSRPQLDWVDEHRQWCSALCEPRSQASIFPLWKEYFSFFSKCIFKWVKQQPFLQQWWILLFVSLCSLLRPFKRSLATVREVLTHFVQSWYKMLLLYNPLILMWVGSNLICYLKMWKKRIIQIVFGCDFECVNQNSLLKCSFCLIWIWLCIICISANMSIFMEFLCIYIKLHRILKWCSILARSRNIWELFPVKLHLGNSTHQMHHQLSTFLK